MLDNASLYLNITYWGRGAGSIAMPEKIIFTTEYAVTHNMILSVSSGVQKIVVETE